MGYPTPEHRPALRQGMAITSLVLGILSLPTWAASASARCSAWSSGSSPSRARTASRRSTAARDSPSAASRPARCRCWWRSRWRGSWPPSRSRACCARGCPPTSRPTIGDIRTVISAEAAYQSANGGYYGPLECLAAPATCLPALLRADLPRARRSRRPTVKNGYRRTFHPGPAVAAGRRRHARAAGQPRELRLRRGPRETRARPACAGSAATPRAGSASPRTDRRRR